MKKLILPLLILLTGCSGERTGPEMEARLESIQQLEAEGLIEERGARDGIFTFNFARKGVLENEEQLIEERTRALLSER